MFERRTPERAGPIVDPVDLHGARLFRTGVSEHYVAPHAHRETQLSLRLSGVGSGLVAFANSFEPHGGLSLAGEIALVYFEPEYLSHLAWDEYGASVGEFDVRRIHDDAFVQAVVSEAARLIKNGVRSRMLVECAVALVANRIVSVYAARGPFKAREGRRFGARTVAHVVARLREHSLPLPTLHELASSLDLSPSQFLRQFKNSTGLTPRQFIIRHRLERARSLLLDTDASLSAIAAECDFASHSHFTSSFKQRFGVTPSRYRERRC